MSINQFHIRALSFASSQLDSWKLISLSDSSIIWLCGNSNKVFLLSTNLPIVPQKLIYRIFGPNEITNKARERKIFTNLSSIGFGPKNLGDSTTERLEEYLEGYTPTPNNLFFEQNFIANFLHILKEFHYFDMSNIVKNEGNIIEINIHNWLNLIKSKLHLFESIGKLNEILEIISESTLNSFWSVVPTDSEMVYCHLDPAPTNILYNSTNSSVRIVDFEFSGMTYRSIDFGLLLNDIVMDYYYDKTPFFRVNEGLVVDDNLIKSYALAYGEGKEMWVEIKRSIIACHFIWCLWSLAFNSGPTEGFDYLEFGIFRYKLFRENLKIYLKNGGVEYLKNIAEDLFLT